MFEMFTRAVFDRFFSDELFWDDADLNDRSTGTNSNDFHFPNLNQQQSARQGSSRVRSSSQQRPPTMSSHARNHVNQQPSSSSRKANEMHFEWLGERSQQKRNSSTSRFDERDSDEENLNDNYVYRQPKPSSIHVHRLRRRPMNNHEKKTESCQFCFLPFTSAETCLEHELSCRYRTANNNNQGFRTKSHSGPKSNPISANADKLFVSKCSYCHQEVRLSDRLDHEALCKQFGTKRQTTAKASEKRFHNSTSGSFNGDSQRSAKPASGNKKQPSSENTTTQ